MGNKPYKPNAVPAHMPALPDDLAEAVISTDGDWKIKSWNKAAEELYGLDKQHALGKMLMETVCFGFVNDTFSRFISQLANSPKWTGKMLYIHKDGFLKCIHSAVSAVTDNSGITIGYVMINHDVSRPGNGSAGLKCVFDPLFQCVGIVKDQADPWLVILHWHENK